MKNVMLKLALVAAAAISTNAMADKVATVDTTATIVDNLAITPGADLAFGQVVKTGSATTKVIAAAEGATFTVTGAAGQEYSVEAEASDMTGPAGSTPMTVTDILVVGNDDLSAGSDDLTVGATLNVAADQAEGDYAGTLTLTVDYVADAGTGGGLPGGDLPDFPPSAP